MLSTATKGHQKRSHLINWNDELTGCDQEVLRRLEGNLYYLPNDYNPIRIVLLTPSRSKQ